MSVTDFLDNLARFTHEKFGEEMARARDDYFRRLGIVHESDELYEEAMKAYLDWFLFDRHVEGEGPTPIRLFIEQVVPALPPEEAEVYRGFGFSGRKSLFQIKKVLRDAIKCRDLFSRDKKTILEDTTTGFFKSEIFEARIFPFQGAWRLGEMLRFHPPRANRVIAKAAKGITDSSDQAARDLMLRLAECKMKHFRFPRVDCLQFYAEILK